VEISRGIGGAKECSSAHYGQ